VLLEYRLIEAAEVELILPLYVTAKSPEKHRRRVILAAIGGAFSGREHD